MKVYQIPFNNKNHEKEIQPCFTSLINQTASQPVKNKSASPVSQKSGKAAIEQKRIARQNAEEKLAEKQRLDKAETDLKAGKFICWL